MSRPSWRSSSRKPRESDVPRRQGAIRYHSEIIAWARRVPANEPSRIEPSLLAGGVYPAWRPDGTELYYLNPAGAMMAAPITSTGATLEPGAPVVLFPTRIFGGGEDVQQNRQYDVAPDGRFLINTELDSADAPITLLQNWNPEAKR